MDQVAVIRHKVLVEGLSRRSVAQDMAISRNTIKKYLTNSMPKRIEALPRPRPVLDRVSSRIDHLLEEWRGRTTPKQRITGRRILRQLKEDGYSIGLTAVLRYLREKRRAEAEVYIPLVYKPGEVAQVDFFEVTVDEAGVRKKVWKFIMRLMYSGLDFVWLYRQCNQVSFLDGHVRAFEYFSGVPQRVSYDNLTSAVKHFIGGERQLTERFLALVSHYLFEPCFARPGVGHDKGGVESRGKAIRLQHLTPIPVGESLDEISKALMADIAKTAREDVGRDGRSKLDRFEQEERERLLELPASAFEAKRMVIVPVSSKSLVQIEGATYSVPSSWARLDATAFVGVDQVVIHCHGQVEIYPKQPSGSRLIRYRHYLPELARKPQALRQVATEIVEELGEPFGRLWQLLTDTHGEREAARILSKVLAAACRHTEGTVAQALDDALSAGRADLLALAPKLHSELPRVDVPESLSNYEVEQGHSCDYDFLLAGGAL